MSFHFYLVFQICYLLILNFINFIMLLFFQYFNSFILFFYLPLVYFKGGMTAYKLLIILFFFMNRIQLKVRLCLLIFLFFN